MPRYQATTVALTVATVLTVATSATAIAQNAKSASPHEQGKNLLTKPYLTSTGAVVPKPGRPQSGPETAQDRKVMRQDDKILHSICSNC